VPEHEPMQEPLAEPQLARRWRISALQTAHSGGLRISADLPLVVGSGGGARVTGAVRGAGAPLGPTQATSRLRQERLSTRTTIRCFMRTPRRMRAGQDYACFRRAARAQPAYASSRPRMQFK